MVSREHDLSSLVWLRPAGGRMLARLVENGEYRVYAVTASGLSAAERNWPRLLHEGNWGGFLSPGSMSHVGCLIGLLATVVHVGSPQAMRRSRGQ